eukprot:3349167-Rhodomonas_salina.1
MVESHEVTEREVLLGRLQQKRQPPWRVREPPRQRVRINVREGRAMMPEDDEAAKKSDFVMEEREVTFPFLTRP